MEGNTSFSELQPFFKSKNKNCCWICAEKVNKSAKTRTITENAWPKIRQDAKDWKELNIPEDHRFFQYKLAFDCIKDCDKPIGPIHANCRTSFQTKLSTFKEKYGRVSHTESGEISQEDYSLLEDPTSYHNCFRRTSRGQQE